MDQYVALALGMEVLGRDGIPIGCVKELAADHFLLDRPLQRDIYVPLAAIRRVIHNQVVLAISTADVDRMGWPHPPLL
jgi:hypothetical protein